MHRASRRRERAQRRRSLRTFERRRTHHFVYGWALVDPIDNLPSRIRSDQDAIAREVGWRAVLIAHPELAGSEADSFTILLGADPRDDVHYDIYFLTHSGPDRSRSVHVVRHVVAAEDGDDWFERYYEDPPVAHLRPPGSDADLEPLFDGLDTAREEPRGSRFRRLLINFWPLQWRW